MPKIIRNSPVAGAEPMLPTNIPNAQAITPLTTLFPEREPTIDKPKIASINSSAEPNINMTGRAICTKKVRIIAPKSPPNKEAEKAAPNALDACPFLARGKPSSMVAWLELDPGIPMSIEVKVAEVGMTATSPMSVARADTSSIP